jgi:hypothetical protein
MHCLENMLLILAQRIRAGKDSPGGAGAVGRNAGQRLALVHPATG